jgi:GT2 family glycosyltransferase
MVKPAIDIVAVNYQRYDLTKHFLDSFYEHEPSAKYTLTVVDNTPNNSDDRRLEYIKDYYPIKDFHDLDAQKNLGYSKACNLGASLGNHEYIGLFNNDIQFVNNTCIDKCITFLDQNPDVGIVGPFQYSTRMGQPMITHAGILGPPSDQHYRGWLETDITKYAFNEEVSMVMGSAMIIRREFWDKMRLDPIFLNFFPDALGAMPHTQLYYEDTTLCYAAPYFGYKVYYLGEDDYRLIHQWHETIKDNPHKEDFESSKKIFINLMNRWGIDV